ncbi:hypothetical protein [Kibdelosporangium phytohabitans]|uniref:Uncharacterized protein n=1 Tax=Kibdelosporangium phytohabitans TaxID=860235 RepID=A0A0N9I1U6_9PSEU|nr:hypothetical protein [Kibdelosporangium phytohabitans]ALG08416.1 hypothetical protein AOZ06_17185 [Kibdelosporangium phytohabitans]MBE1470535.1 hypothetical protein [Kibdelosporangium phytohabitans]
MCAFVFGSRSDQSEPHDWLAGGYSRRVVAMGGLTVYDKNPRRREERTGRRVADWSDPGVWPPSASRDLNPVIDVEDPSLILSEMDNEVYAGYQQCHYTPDCWRSYTVLGDHGRMENFGDGVIGEEAVVRVWNRGRSGYRTESDLTVAIVPEPGGSHGGADAELVAEFLRFVAEGTDRDVPGGGQAGRRGGRRRHDVAAVGQQRRRGTAAGLRAGPLLRRPPGDRPHCPHWIVLGAANNRDLADARRTGLSG